MPPDDEVSAVHARFRDYNANMNDTEQSATNTAVQDTASPETSEATREEAAPDTEELALRVEAALFSSDRALPAARLNELLGKPGAKAIQAAVDTLNGVYEASGRSFRIEAVAAGFKVMTLPKFAEVLKALHRSRQDTRLTPAAMETLAIIAYKQPILRSQIEAIRGVASGEVIRSLMERHMVKIAGRAEEIGRPMLYGTTKTFLEVFGLSGLEDLPKADEFKAKAPTG